MSTWRWGAADWSEPPTSVRLLQGPTAPPPSPGLPRYVFNTANVAPEERYALFSKLFASHFESQALTNDFEAELSFYVLGLGQAHFSIGRTGPERARRTSEQCAADGLDMIFLNLQVGGRFSGSHGQRAIQVQPGDVVVTDLAQPLDVEHEGVQERISLGIPRAVVLEMIAEDVDLQGLLFRGDAGCFLADFLRNLARRAPDLPSTVGPAIVRAGVELLAVSADAAEPERAAAAEPAGDLFDSMRAAIDARLTDPELTPASLAREQGLSRTALYAMFEPLGGVSNFIRMRRLEAVHQALLSESETRSIADIAYAWGFVSQAHFSRAFRNIYGRTPGEVRAIGRSEPRPS